MAGKNTLIVQFPRGMNPGLDFDGLEEIESSLRQGLLQNRSGVVDGHDWGAAGANVFVHAGPGKAWPSLEVVKAYLQCRGVLGSCLIVKRFKSERYEVVWPEGYEGEFERT